MSGFKMDDYVPVNERISAFKEEHPDGSLQSEIVELTVSRVTIKAYAYRTPDDERPGIGHSSLEIPGSTSFTRGSEIENAETSAWGRAIAALGFEVKRGLASAEEVRNKQPERGRGGSPSSPSAPAPVRTAEEQGLLDELLQLTGGNIARMELLAKAVGVPAGTRANADQLREMIAQASLPLPEAASAHAAPASAPGDGGPPSPVSGAPLTLDDVLEVTGGELIPPRPGTDDYKALPAQERAEARVYWTARDKEGVLA